MNKEKSHFLSSLLYTEASEKCEKVTIRDLDVEDPDEEEAIAALEEAKIEIDTQSKTN